MKPSGLADDAAVKPLKRENVPAAAEGTGETSPTVDKVVSLSTLSVVDSDHSVRIKLSFTGFPAYRLLQRGDDTAPLVVSFDKADLGPEFDIPDLNFDTLDRISILPRQETLQLLVDLPEHAQVQAFQMVEVGTGNYQLWIDIVRGDRPAQEVAADRSDVADAASEKSVAQTEQPAIEESSAETVPLQVSRHSEVLDPEQLFFRQGMTELKKRNLTAARRSFEAVLAINPKQVDARLQLARLFQMTSELDKVETLLSQGLSVAFGNAPLKKYYARFLLQQQRPAEAFDILSAEPYPELALDFEYHALLAALLQETKQFQASGTLYRQLLDIDSRQPLWWMGLGIARDQVGEYKQARDAYRNALSLPGLKPELTQYIQDRLQVL